MKLKVQPQSGMVGRLASCLLSDVTLCISTAGGQAVEVINTLKVVYRQVLPYESAHLAQN